VQKTPIYFLLQKEDKAGRSPRCTGCTVSISRWHIPSGEKSHAYSLTLPVSTRVQFPSCPHLPIPPLTATSVGRDHLLIVESWCWLG